MYRIDNDTAVSSLPTPAAIGPNPNYFFTKGDPNSGIPATVVNADWANAVQEELCYVIEQSGATLSKTDRTQLLTAIKTFIQGGLSAYTASTTAANTYTATLSPVPAAYVTGMRVFIKFSNHNTGAATINLNSLGAKSIVHPDGSALAANDIADGMVALVAYDGTNFQLEDTNITNYLTVIQAQSGSVNYAASTTAANTYTATLAPAPTAYTTGMPVRILFTNANTGAATINLNSLGAKSIVTSAGAALAAGQIAAGMMVTLVYDGTNFQITNPIQVAQFMIAPLSKSSSYALGVLDQTVSFTAAATATLPTAVGYAGLTYNILNSATTNANVTIATTSAQTIGGRASSDIVLARPGDFVTVRSDGANWLIIDKREYTFLSNYTAGHAVTGSTGSYQSGGANVTLGIGRWRCRMYVTMNMGASSVACVANYLSGFFAADGANTGTPPTSISNISGDANYNALSGGGTYNPIPNQSATGNYILFPIECEVVVTSGTQAVYAIANASFSNATNFSVGTAIEATRIS